MFLFSRAQGNVTVAHHLYWLILICLISPDFLLKIYNEYDC